MKFIGKLLAITVLLSGFNLHSFAYASPAVSTGNAQDKASGKPLNIASDNNAKVKSAQTHGAEKLPDSTKNMASGLPASALESQQSQISINSANTEQLAQFLSGIGKKKAEAIVIYREQSGPFTDIEQLLEVPGIGPSFLEKNSTKIKL